jgi:hypothetical protein
LVLQLFKLLSIALLPSFFFLSQSQLFKGIKHQVEEIAHKKELTPDALLQLDLRQFKIQVLDIVEVVVGVNAAKVEFESQWREYGLSVHERIIEKRALAIPK